MSQPTRFEELEAYRGVAALAVVVFHAYQYTRAGTQAERYLYEGTPLHNVFFNLEAGVPWFFVLSGFLVFLPFARATVWQESPESARGFLLRRLIRVVPVYYGAIIVVWAWRFGGGGDQWLDLIEHLTFTHVFDRRYIFWTIGPAWSLANEVIYYGVVALLGVILYRIARRLADPHRRFILLSVATLAMVALSLAYKWWAAFVARIPGDDFPVWFGPVARIDTFAAGMFLAVVVAGRSGRSLFRGQVSAVVRLAGFGLTAFAFGFRLSVPLVDLYFHSLAGLGFLLILSSTVLGDRGTAWETVLSHPFLQFLGLVSYSLYLWHEPLLLELSQRGFLFDPAPSAFWSNALWLSCLGIAVASLSYLCFERPAGLLRHLFDRRGRLVRRYPSEMRRAG